MNFFHMLVQVRQLRKLLLAGLAHITMFRLYGNFFLNMSITIYKEILKATDVHNTNIQKGWLEKRAFLIVNIEHGPIL